MKALIRQYPATPTKPSEDEVLIQSAWLDWMGENGEPLTDENYGYAFCADLPDECADTAIPSDFVITSEVRTEPDLMGEGTVEIRSWKAAFDRSRWETHQAEGPTV